MTSYLKFTTNSPFYNRCYYNKKFSSHTILRSSNHIIAQKKNIKTTKTYMNSIRAYSSDYRYSLCTSTYNTESFPSDFLCPDKVRSNGKKESCKDIGRVSNDQLLDFSEMVLIYSPFGKNCIVSSEYERAVSNKSLDKIISLNHYHKIGFYVDIEIYYVRKSFINNAENYVKY